nr:tetratricopeptide repeat protein [uncultured Desulfuromonas sp.]
MLYRKQGKHELAYEYFEKAYTGDPSYWAAPAIALIPDSLVEMGEFERALKRCDELLEENRNKRRIVDKLSKVKRAIQLLHGKNEI